MIAGEMQGGQYSTCNAGNSRQADGDGESGGIDGGVLQERNAKGLESGQDLGRPSGKRNAYDRASEREDETFCERLLDEVTSASAEGDADGELLPAHVDAGEQEVG
jgi:hypothetical protein